MLQDNKNQFLEKLRELGIIPSEQGINYKFDPYDADILRINWDSPNDGLANVFRLTLNPKDLATIRIKDNH